MSQRFIARVRFLVPEPPPAQVTRQRLVDRLTAATEPTTLVVGAPGAGKTAVLGTWVTARRAPTAWLSCDPTDADPVRFWAAMAMALQRVVDGAGVDALKRLDEDGCETVDLAASLASDCEFAPDLAIVIDDFHHAGTTPAVFSTFVRSLPSGVRLILASRRDPSFPVGRLRVQGRLLELRDEDLRFTLDEAGELFANLGIALDAPDLGRLCDLTEGWAAGLQLAALSLATRPDASGLVDAFASSDRGVADFLVNEVIDAQPPEIADFLMQTSVLEAFDGSLCDAVTGRTDSGELLQRLHEAHLFVIALDRRAGWYRYHRLFAAFLQARLRAVSRLRFERVHATASRVLAEQGDLMNAVRHAMAADDVDAALQLVRQLAAANLDLEERQAGIDTVRAWLRMYGERYVELEPNILLECCLVLAATGAPDDVEVWLHRVEHGRSAPLTPADTAFLHAVWGLHVLHRGDPEAAIARVRQAQRLLRDHGAQHFWVAQSPIVECHAHLLLGDAAATQRAVEAARATWRTAPLVDTVRFPGFLAFAAVLAGELTEAERQAGLALDVARSAGLGEGNLAVVLPRLSKAAVAREHDDLAAAARELAIAEQIAVDARRQPTRFLCALERVRLAATQGNRGAALAMLAEARGIMPTATRPMTDQLDRFEARMAIDAGDGRGHELVEALLPSVGQQLLRARLAIEAGDHAAARVLLDEATAQCANRRLQIEHGLLRARATVPVDRNAALAVVDEVLRRAEPVGMVRAVLDGGPAIHALLEAVPTDARRARFAATVLDAAYHRAAPAGQNPPQRLVEPLSERELGVLRYLASRLTYAEMAGHLYISVNTLKSHVKAVYRKLGASTRAEAVQIARDRGLL